MPDFRFSFCRCGLLLLGVLWGMGVMLQAQTNFLDGVKGKGKVPDFDIAPMVAPPLAGPVPDIHDAAAKGNVDKITALLASDPTLLESKDESGLTPLLVAVREGKVEAVKLLLAKGADITATTKTGSDDALCIAAKNGQKDVVTILLDKGADASRKDGEGNTPGRRTSWRCSRRAGLW